MGIAEQTTTKHSFLERPIITTWAINWEMALYAAIFLIAVTTRFYGLGLRVMSHDESLHAFFAYKLYNGGGYIHDPRLHGPLQFFLTALSFLLFGANDFTARIPATLFGVILVILPYWFKPWLGRIGALVTSLGLLISPSLLFYQRYIRNEALILVFTTLMILSLFKYMRTRRVRWLYVGAAAMALSLATKEVALIHGFIGVAFIGIAFLWEQLSPRRLKLAVFLLVGIIGLLLVGALWLAVANHPDWARNLVLMAGLLAGALTIVRNVDQRNKPVSSTLLSLKDSDVLTGPVALAMIIFILLYTSFFTNLAGLRSGTYGAVTHWLGQQSVARGGQPGYYYLMLMTLYEFLPLLVGGIGGTIYLVKKAPAHTMSSDIRTNPQTLPAKKSQSTPKFSSLYPSDGGTFAAYLIFWAISSFVIYSWAGEKMPWLNVHIALPFIFLVGHLSQSVLNQPLNRSKNGLQWGSPLYLGLLVALTALTVRFAWLSSFVNYDYVNELLVYAHGAPDVKQVLHQVDNLSRNSVGDRQLKIAYGGIAWPLAWYMRQYPNAVYFGDKPTKERLDMPVILFAPNSNLSDVSVEDIEPFLDDRYVRFDYHLVWWPLEAYKDQTLSQLWHAYLQPDKGETETLRRNWESLWQYIFYRNTPGYSFEQWPNRTPLYLFVRKDLVSGLKVKLNKTRLK